MGQSRFDRNTSSESEEFSLSKLTTAATVVGYTIHKAFIPGFFKRYKGVADTAKSIVAPVAAPLVFMVAAAAAALLFALAVATCIISFVVGLCLKPFNRTQEAAEIAFGLGVIAAMVGLVSLVAAAAYTVAAVIEVPLSLGAIITRTGTTAHKAIGDCCASEDEMRRDDENREDRYSHAPF